MHFHVKFIWRLYLSASPECYGLFHIIIKTLLIERKRSAVNCSHCNAEIASTVRHLDLVDSDNMAVSKFISNVMPQL